MATFPSLQALCTAALSCTSCGLANGRTQVVPGEGSSTADVMFIGEGPGYHEDQQGKPFVGPAGKLLDDLIGLIEMNRSDVYIANMVKCRPPGNRDPLPEEVDACQPWLTGQIKLIDPKLIVTLGRHSLQRFLPGASINKVHGQPRDVNGRTIMPVHHPAAALYQATLRPTLEADFKKIPSLLAHTDEVPAAESEPKQLGLF